MKSKSFKLSGQKGFSLVELLVVIAVIAIIAAIAIPNIANITSQAGVAKDRRNAQNIASVAAAARAAGATNDVATVSGALANLVGNTLTVTVGGQPLTFGVSAMGATELTNVALYLSNNPDTTNGAVIYVPGL